jgi:hypothetical protein
MAYLLLKFLHVGSMFLATALAVGPSILLYLIARTGNVDAIRRAFGHATAVFRIGGAFYGLGLLFGFLAAALSGEIDLTARWLITAYVLVGVLIVFNIGFERWTRRIEKSVANREASTDLADAIAARAPIYALSGMVVLTLLVVFVMVVKPALF